jgi:hypothetical protein
VTINNPTKNANLMILDERTNDPSAVLNLNFGLFRDNYLISFVPELFSHAHTILFDFHAKTILTMDTECCLVSFFGEVSQRQLAG